ncbi:transposase [Granulicatella sp. zg-ZJ]|uniref:transposase n=1 Tax=Granulicatella sp. zg-ZJ TaxID=2678504 RepID=UPI0013D0A894
MIYIRKKFYIFKTYQNGIYQAFIIPYSNGITEAINNHIKVIKRITYDYRRFSYFRLRILIIQHHSQWQKKNVKKVVNG